MSVLVREHDGLWEARLARELEPEVEVFGYSADASGDVLVLTADTANEWLREPVQLRAKYGTVLVVCDDDDPAWYSAGVSCVFPATAPASQIAESIRRTLTKTA